MATLSLLWAGTGTDGELATWIFSCHDIIHSWESVRTVRVQAAMTTNTRELTAKAFKLPVSADANVLD